MTNKEWLDYLAQNAPDELAAWFDAEHVETEERALDGDTESENEDSRDKLEADVRKIAEAYNMDEQRHGTERFEHELYYSIIHLLDRQAAITERECRKPNWDYCETCETLAELTAERDKLQEQLRIGWECECRLQAERDKFKEANDYHAAQYELASEDADRLQAQVDRLKAERVKLRSQICKLEDDLVRANDENKRVSFADRIRFVDEIDELTAECDNLKANNEQLHTLAGEQAAKIDELQSAFDAICANLSIIANGEPDMLADIAIETIDALIDECNTANRQCNEYRSKFGKCIDYADAIHALMDDEGMA